MPVHYCTQYPCPICNPPVYYPVPYYIPTSPEADRIDELKEDVKELKEEIKKLRKELAKK